MKQAVLLALLLGGCVGEAAVPDPPLNDCQKMAKLLGSQYLDPFQKQTILEKMRNQGCMSAR